jgi:hypothetical protein
VEAKHRAERRGPVLDPGEQLLGLLDPSLQQT